MTAVGVEQQRDIPGPLWGVSDQQWPLSLLVAQVAPLELLADDLGSTFPPCSLSLRCALVRRCGQVPSTSPCADSSLGSQPWFCRAACGRLVVAHLVTVMLHAASP